MLDKSMLTLKVSDLWFGKPTMEGAARACAPDTQGAVAMARNSGLLDLLR